MRINQRTAKWNELKADVPFLHWMVEEFNLILTDTKEARPATFYKKRLLSRWEALGLFRDYLLLVQEDPYRNMTKILRYINVSTTEAIGICSTTEAIGICGEWNEQDVGWVDLDRVVGYSAFPFIDNYLELLDVIRFMADPTTSPPLCVDVVGNNIEVNLPSDLRDYAPIQVIENTLSHFYELTSTTPTELRVDTSKKRKRKRLTMSPREELRVRTLYELGRRFLPVVLAPPALDITTIFPHLWESV